MLFNMYIHLDCDRRVVTTRGHRIAERFAAFSRAHQLSRCPRIGPWREADKMDGL